jgi:hypothetical protein
MSYIGASDLVFNNSDGIYGGGFNVQSIMMKSGISPIMTLNSSNLQNGGTNEKVSDIFGGLAIPAYAYYNNFQIGGKHDYRLNENNSDEDDIIDDDLHDKLLELMRNQDNDIKQNKKRLTRKNNKNKNSGTKKNKNSK